MTFSLKDSIGKKIYSITGIALLAILMTLFTGLYFAKTLNRVSILSMFERGHTVNLFMALTNFNQYAHNGDKRDFELFEKYIGETISYNKTFMTAMDDLRTKSTSQMATILDKTFSECNYEEAKDLVNILKKFSSNPYVVKLIELSATTNRLANKVDDLAGKYVAARNSAEQKNILNKMNDLEKEIRPVTDDFSETISSISRWALSLAKKILWIVFFLSAGTSIIIAVLITRSITTPVRQVINRLEELSSGDGDLTARIEVKSKDELAQLAKAFNLFAEKIQAMIKDIADNAETLNESASGLSSISGQMSEGAEQTSGKSNTVASAAEEMSSNMNSVAAATEEASTNINLVAAATEEMTSTINEIAQNSEKARTVTEDAVSQARNASVKVDTLGKAANEIGKVTETITEISEQTNLLALNATIEAARAGEAGKGFAVVANEIKELARQTAEATREIKGKIEGIQGSTSDTVTEIEQISKVIDDVNEIVATIATAVEEQSVTSREIAGNVSQASQGISEVTENVAQSSTVAGEIAMDIADVNQAAGEISNSSSQINLSADELTGLAGQLKEMVGRFKV